MGALVNVRLCGPVKNSAGWHDAGDIIPVAPAEAESLCAQGVAILTVAGEIKGNDFSTLPGFAEAVAAKANALADEVVGTAVEAAVKEFVDPLQAELSALKAENRALAEELAALKGPDDAAPESTLKPADKNKG